MPMLSCSLVASVSSAIQAPKSLKHDKSSSCTALSASIFDMPSPSPDNSEAVVSTRVSAADAASASAVCSPRVVSGSLHRSFMNGPPSASNLIVGSHTMQHATTRGTTAPAWATVRSSRAIRSSTLAVRTTKGSNLAADTIHPTPSQNSVVTAASLSALSRSISPSLFARICRSPVATESCQALSRDTAVDVALPASNVPRMRSSNEASPLHAANLLASSRRSNTAATADKTATTRAEPQRTPSPSESSTNLRRTPMAATAALSPAAGNPKRCADTARSAPRRSNAARPSGVAAIPATTPSASSASSAALLSSSTSSTASVNSRISGCRATAGAAASALNSVSATLLKMCGGHPGGTVVDSISRLRKRVPILQWTSASVFGSGFINLARTSSEANRASSDGAC
mmetsp:Transcript_35/g.104  ORF Transcript_35/g.104 Transcript_35/m.104 type:complete len:403 (-) Transcript_35:4-1212(-)